MTGLTDPADAPTGPAEPAMPGENPPHELPPVPPQQVADERRIHLYEAVSTQRDKVLDSFDTQRAAVLKAVADQRTAALAPITAVNMKRAMQLRAASTPNSPVPPTGGIATSASGTIGAAGRRQLMIEARRAAAAQIVAALKMLIAAEVRAQLDAALQAPQASQERTQPGLADADSAVGPQGQRDQA